MLLQKYAELILEQGINLQKDEYVLITSPLEAKDFVRMLQKIAFLKGAKDVIIHWTDDELNKNRMIYTTDEVLFADVDSYTLKERIDLIINKKAALIGITSPTPNIFTGVDAQRVGRYQKSIGDATAECRKRQMSNINKWCVCAYANPIWAKKVFPDLEKELAVEKLQEIIYKCCLVDEKNNPAEEIAKKNKLLAARSKYLNEAQFAKFHFKTGLGTDLIVGMPQNYLFAGGSEYSAEQIEFQANIPTEEVFSAPHSQKVDGRVVASKPLLYQGKVIRGIDLTFKDGKVVKYSATENEEALKSLIEQDATSCRLGEVALVPHSSPISQTDVLFYNTLFDENASCHLALGMAYPLCLKNGTEMSKEELEKAGLNISTVHVDFMFGTSDLQLEAELPDGTRTLLMQDGEFCF